MDQVIISIYIYHPQYYVWLKLEMIRKKMLLNDKCRMAEMLRDPLEVQKCSLRSHGCVTLLYNMVEWKKFDKSVVD